MCSCVLLYYMSWRQRCTSAGFILYVNFAYECALNVFHFGEAKLQRLLEYALANLSRSVWPVFLLDNFVCHIWSSESMTFRLQDILPVNDKINLYLHTRLVFNKTISGCNEPHLFVSYLNPNSWVTRAHLWAFWWVLNFFIIDPQFS